MYEIRESTVDEMMANAGTLFAAHYDELALNKSVMVLEPDGDKYRAIEAEGRLFILVATLGSAIVGYSVNFVANHLHYASLRVSSNDLLFVDPDHRQSRVGMMLLRATEQAARDRGAGMQLWHAKPGTQLEQLLGRLGYGVQDIIFSREV